MKTKFEITNINEDVISTSEQVLFNTAEIRTTKWFFYNTDFDKDGNDMTPSVQYYDHLSYYGVDEATALEYQTLAANQTIFPERDTTIYHYIDGQWVKCTHSKNHRTMIG